MDQRKRIRVRVELCYVRRYAKENTWQSQAKVVLKLLVYLDFSL